MLTKVPRAGRVKTRLVPPLTPVQAAALAAAFIRDLGVRLERLAEEYHASTIVYYAPSDEGAALARLVPQLRIVPQTGVRLGNRLRGAVLNLAGEGFEHIILIGSDSPTLPAGLFTDAFAALEDGADVGIARADDGGYVLMGLAGAHIGVFEDIPWSTDQVYSATMRRARALGLRAAELRSWYDVDDARGLGRLRAEIAKSAAAAFAPHTRATLASLDAAWDAAQSGIPE
ncbi:MAG: TIGR04282 family arsenosugar biosynthesis glycosyltransferase [Candidatus Elarobacter sp.]